MKTVVTIGIALISLYFLQLYFLGRNYESIAIPSSANMAIQTMGQPSQIEFCDELCHDKDAVVLRYFETPLPTEYVLEVKNGVVINKWRNVSP